MANITINGNNIVGRNITITNNKIIIDGKDVSPDSKTIDIKIEGDIENFEVDYCNKIEIIGNTKDIRTSSGDVDITGNVTGNINTSSGDVDIAGDVQGSINTSSGDVDCYNVSGNVKTNSGDIKTKKS
ncbi:hypothetical protein M0Q50_02250 [bacterium]|jgi:hypothetical protein|nr:hypothetical protein [bacterium]